jgi:hypothetical protein
MTLNASCPAGMTVPPPAFAGACFEHAAQALDMGGGPVREIAQGAFTDLAVLAEGLAQQHGGGRVAVRDGFDIHGPIGVDSVTRYGYERVLHGHVLGGSWVTLPGLPRV